MKQVPIRLGPLALLLTVITICMTVLGILTFSTARADLAMAEKLARSTQERYALEEEGQAFLCQLGQGDGSNAADVSQALKKLDKDENGIYRKTFSRDGLHLEIGLEWSEKEGTRVVSWKFSRDWQAPEEIGGLWLGE